MATIDAAIQPDRQALDSTPDDHPDRAERLLDLGIRLGNRYSRAGIQNDLDEAIEIFEQAVKLTPDNDVNRARRLHNLGIGYSDRYSRTGLQIDFDKTIQTAQQAIDRTPKTSLNEAKRSNLLGIGLMERYYRTESLFDLNSAIEIFQQQLDSTPVNYPDRIMWLNNSGIGFRERYGRTGSQTDINKSIQLAQETVDLTPNDNPCLAQWLNNLRASLGDRYLTAGSQIDLEKSILVFRQAIDLTPSNHPDYTTWLNNLGVSLGDRYSEISSQHDLDEAIQVARQVIDLTQDGHPKRSMWLNNLGIRLGNRYWRTNSISDLTEAIELFRQCTNLLADDHPGQILFLANMGKALEHRYLGLGIQPDLDDSIQIARQVIHSTPDGHSDRAKWFDHSGRRLGYRYSNTGLQPDLDEAIQIARQAVDLTPNDHSGRAERLYNLGTQVLNRYMKTDSRIDLDEAISLDRSALYQSNSPVANRISAGRRLYLLWMLEAEWQEAYKVASITVRLVPRLISRSLGNPDKQFLLAQAVGLACNASALALHVAMPPWIALNLLEEGRGLLATTVQDMRMETIDLQAKQPELAKHFVRLRRELGQPPRFNGPFADDNRRLPSKSGEDRRYNAGRELDEIINEIRKHPDFKDFLLTPNEEEVKKAAEQGPIVLINVSTLRCDTILVEREQIRSVNLPDLHSKDIKSRAGTDSRSYAGVLEWLWDVVTNPILDALGFWGPPLNGVWPYIWWIPTGYLSKFPLHAAGYHSKRSNQSVLDRVISSYSSSIKTIINGRQLRTSESTRPICSRALIIAMKNTPKQITLPAAENETAVVRKFCRSIALDSIEPERRKQDVLSCLSDSQIFHFAGHGYIDGSDPSKSGLLLQDWESDRLTLADLLEINLSQGSPFLAYLSACGTGEIQDQRFFDESIHLISACQLAGFRHVIGTLWKVDDETCVEVARMTYQWIKDGIKDREMSDESVCLGLHQALRELRDFWLSSRAKTDSIRRSFEEGTKPSVENKTETPGINEGDDGHDGPRDAELDDDFNEDTELINWVPVTIAPCTTS